MKRMLGFSLGMLLLLALVGCDKGYAHLSADNEGQSIQWEVRTYYLYGELEDTSLKGVQVGIVNGDSARRVYEIKGLDAHEWLVEHNRAVMSTANVYRAAGVQDIPRLILDYVRRVSSSAQA